MRYAILTTPRTGGRALCDCLAQTGVAGMVGKDGGVRGNELWFGAGEALKLVNLKVATDKFFAANRTSNGVEGVKINFPYLMTLVKWQGWGPVEDIIRSLDYAVILDRRDKVAQAVSLYIAQATGEWSSLDEPNGHQPEYNYDAIAALIARIEMGHAWMGEMVFGYCIPNRRLYYEQLRDDLYISSTWAILSDLGIEHDVFKTTPRLSQQVDIRKAEMVERFKQEYRRDPYLV